MKGGCHGNPGNEEMNDPINGNHRGPAGQKCYACRGPEETWNSCCLAPGRWLCRSCFEQLNNEWEFPLLVRQAMDEARIIVPAGQKCAHCGDPTPLGGTCPDCGQNICTRSQRVRMLAQETGFNPHWACPVANPMTTAHHVTN